MKGIDSGLEKIEARIDQSGESDHVDIGAEAAANLIEKLDSQREGFGIYYSHKHTDDSDSLDKDVVASLHDAIQELNGDVEFQTDGKATSEVRILQMACSEHTARTEEEDDRYSLAVCSGGNEESGMFGFAYLIGRDPFLKLSTEGGMEGISVQDQTTNYGDNEFSENLNDMRTALEDFVDHAATDTFSYGSSVDYTDSDKTLPSNLEYAFLSIDDMEKYKDAAKLGYVKLKRESDSGEVDYDSDPDSRDHEQYLENISNDDGFQEFWETALEPPTKLRQKYGCLNHGNISLARLSSLLDAEKNDRRGLMMVGALGVGGRNSEVHAEEIVGKPEIYIDSPEFT